MTRVECIADRFVMTDRSHAIDLATGDMVTMILSAAGDRDEHARWVSRCDAFYGRHALAADNLVDFGRCGPSHRFEAWQPACRSLAKPPVAAIRHIERRVERALAELFEQPGLSSRCVCVFGPPGCGKTRVLMRLARSARAEGFIPLAVDLLDSPLSAVVDGRSVCLIDDERSGSLAVLAEVALRSPRPHVVLRASTDDAGNVPSVRLLKLSTNALVSALVTEAAVSEAAVRRAAARADGNPGRFINAISPV